MRPLEPTNIFLGEADVSVEDEARKLASELERLIDTGDFDRIVPVATTNPVAIFALGVVGGVLGARFLKGTTGMVVGAGLAWWGWNELSTPKTVAERRADEVAGKKDDGVKRKKMPQQRES
jgi:hypothetical protein